MRFRRTLLLLLFLLCCGALETMHAQTARGWFQSPTDGATGVSVTPTIVIRTNYPIDTNCLHWTPPYGLDSTDSLYTGIHHRPNIFLRDSSIHLPDSLWIMAATYGEITLTDDSTLSFTSSHLEYGTTYAVTLHGIRVRVPRSGGPDTIVHVPDSTIYFTTMPRPIGIFTTSIDPGSSIKCSDPVQVKFTRALSSTSVAGNNIIELYQAEPDTIGTDTSGEGYLASYRMTAVAGQSYTLTSDPSVIEGTASFEPGKQYTMVVRGDLLSGNPVDKYSVPFEIKNTFTVSASSRFSDGSTNTVLAASLLPALSSGTYHAGESVSWLALKRIGDYEFDHWSSSDPTFDGSTDTQLDLTQTCDQLHDVTLEAVYDTIPVDTIRIPPGSFTGGTFNVFDWQGNPITGSETGDYLIKRGEYAYVQAVPAAGNAFGAFNSSYSAYNAYTPSTLIINDDGNWGTPTVQVGGSFPSAGLVGSGPCVIDAYISVYGAPAPPSGTAGQPSIATLSPSSGTAPNIWQEEYLSYACGSTMLVSVNLDPGWILSSYTVTTWNGSAYVSGPPTFVNATGSYTVMTTYGMAGYPTWVVFNVVPSWPMLTVNLGFDGSTPTDGYQHISYSLNKSGSDGLYALSEHNDPGTPTLYYSKDPSMTVEVRPQSDMAEITWSRWDSSNGHKYSVYQNQTVYMNQNPSVLGLFKDSFTIVEVGVNDDASDAFAVHWYPAKDFSTKSGLRITPALATTKAGTVIRFRFNQSVDLTKYTWARGSYTTPKIYGYETSQRIDYLPWQWYETQNSNTAATTWSSYNGNANAEVAFRLDNPGGDGILGTSDDVYLSKMTGAEIVVRGDVTSTSGAKLGVDESFDIVTEYPGLRVFYKKVTCTKDTDGFPRGDPDVYTTYACGYWPDPTSNASTASSGTVPYSTPNSSDNVSTLAVNESATYNFPILDVPKLAPQSQIRIAFQSFDSDHSKLRDEMDVLLRAISDGLKNTNLNADFSLKIDSNTSVKLSANLTAMPAAIVGAMAKIDSLQNSDNDDSMGGNYWLGNAANHWLHLYQSDWVRQTDAVKHEIEVVIDP